VIPIDYKMQMNKFRWFGHVPRRKKIETVRMSKEMVMESRRKR